MAHQLARGGDAPHALSDHELRTTVARRLAKTVPKNGAAGVSKPCVSKVRHDACDKTTFSRGCLAKDLRESLLCVLLLHKLEGGELQ